MKTKKGQDYILTMLEETFEVADRDEVLEPEAVFNMTFNRKKSCYSLKIKEHYIEIPSNWGPFKGKGLDVFDFSVHEFDDHVFLDIVSGVLGRRVEHIKFQLLGDIPLVSTSKVQVA